MRLRVAPGPSEWRTAARQNGRSLDQPHPRYTWSPDDGPTGSISSPVAVALRRAAGAPGAEDAPAQVHRVALLQPLLPRACVGVGDRLVPVHLLDGAVGAAVAERGGLVADERLPFALRHLGGAEEEWAGDAHRVHRTLPDEQGAALCGCLIGRSAHPEASGGNAH